MDGSSFFINMPGSGLERILTSAERITVTRASGELLEISPGQDTVRVTEEHPPVDRMDGDFGAICEVFRQSSAYFVAVTGCQLAAGDTIQVSGGKPVQRVTLKVVDIEGGRARIDPPEIHL